jgi:hypothetical protein
MYVRSIEDPAECHACLEPRVGALQEPRVIVRAPDGDMFLAESRANRIRVLRDADGRIYLRSEDEESLGGAPPNPVDFCAAELVATRVAPR